MTGGGVSAWWGLTPQHDDTTWTWCEVLQWQFDLWSSTEEDCCRNHGNITLIALQKLYIITVIFHYFYIIGQLSPKFLFWGFMPLLTYVTFNLTSLTTITSITYSLHYILNVILFKIIAFKTNQIKIQKYNYNSEVLHVRVQSELGFDRVGLKGLWKDWHEIPGLLGRSQEELQNSIRTTVIIYLLHILLWTI